MAIQAATLNKSYRIASSTELGYHLLLQVFYLSILCSEEAVLQAAENGDIVTLRELREKGTDFRVSDTVSIFVDIIS